MSLISKVIQDFITAFSAQMYFLVDGMPYDEHKLLPFQGMLDGMLSIF